MKNIEVLKFFAPWCKPCRVYGRTFDIVTTNLNVPTRQINIDDDQEAKDTYNVTQIPTTIVLVDGVEKRRHVGVMLNRDLTHMIEQEAAHDY